MCKHKLSVNGMILYDVFNELEIDEYKTPNIFIDWINTHYNVVIHNINIGNADGFTALHYAVERRLIKLVKLLIKHNADPNNQANNGRTPFNYLDDNEVINETVCIEDIKILKMLIKAGADINNTNNRAPLLITPSYGSNIVTVKMLIKAGANVNMKDVEDKTALDWAIDYADVIDRRYIKIIKLLLNAHMF
jgi:ankyrin repeat protein